MYIHPETLSNQSTPAAGLLELTPEQEALYLQYNGFIVITSTDPVEIEPDTEAWEAWKATLPDPLDEAKSAKIQTFSAMCESTIYAGMDIELPDGSTEHFNYNDHDQINIKEMFDAVRMGATEWPYQAEDGSCRAYTAAEIRTIYPTLAGMKTATITYYHALEDMVNDAQTADAVEAITWGQPLDGDYLTHYNEMLAIAQVQMQTILGVANA